MNSMKKILSTLALAGLVGTIEIKAQNLQWAHGFTTSSTQGGISNKVFIDYTGSDVYNVGKFTTNGVTGTDFDPSAGTNALVTQTNIANSFISKYTSAGAAVMALVFKGGANEIYDVVVDISDNIYVTGYYTGIVDFDPATATSFTLPNTATNDVFVAKINANGSFGWAKRVGGSGNDYGYSIALDASNNVFVAGSFSNTVDFDPGVGTTTLGAIADDAFILKLDNAGNYLNAIKIGDAGADVIRSIKVDANNDLFVCGYYSSAAAFSGAPYSGGFDGMIGKFSTINLTASWLKGFGGTLNDVPLEVAPDGLGSIHCTGYFSGTADFDPGVGVTSFSTSTTTDIDGFVVKLNASGNLTWARQITGVDKQVPQAIGIDNLGDVYVGGSYEGVTDFNPGVGASIHFPLPVSSTSYDIFVLKLSSTGAYLQSQVMGNLTTPSNERCNSLAVEPNTGFYVITGYLNNTAAVDFNTSTGVSNVTADWYLAKYNKCSYPVIPSSATTPTVCSGTAATLTVAASASITTTWYSSVTATSTYSTGSSVNTPVGNYTLWATNTNTCGTTGRASIGAVVDNNFLSVTVSPTTICAGQSTTVTASGAVTYNYGSGTTTATSYTTPVYPNAGVWTSNFTGTSTSGCTQTKSYTVQALGNPTISIFSSSFSGPFCDNTVNTATFTSSGTATSYTWMPGNISGSTAVISFPSTPGTYSVSLTGTGSNGCKTTVVNNTFMVNAAPSVSINSSSTLICVGNTATLQALGAPSNTWLPANVTGGLHTISPTTTTTYTLIGAYPSGCKDTATYTQSVSLCSGINALSGTEGLLFSLYPNPSNGLFHLNTETELSIMITDALGNEILRTHLATGEHEINLTEYSNGIYFVRIKNSEGSGMVKLIKN